MDFESPGGCSYAGQIAALAVGESYSRALRIDGDNCPKKTVEAATNALRDLMRSAVSRAKQRAGGVYVVETGEFRTRSRDVIVSAVVTRTQ